MTKEQVFAKELTDTDINYRLCFPSDKLGILRGADTRVPAEFPVKCGEKVYEFRCIKRHEGPPKPVIQRGWSEVVRDNHLQIDDYLEFYMEANDGGSTNYYIEVHRRVPSYVDGYATTYDWQRIV